MVGIEERGEEVPVCNRMLITQSISHRKHHQPTPVKPPTALTAIWGRVNKKYPSHTRPLILTPSGSEHSNRHLNRDLVVLLWIA